MSNAALDNTIDAMVRTALLVMTTFVLMDFWALDRSDRDNKLVRGLMIFVASTWLSILWYVAGSLSAPEVERWYLDHGYITQFPRLVATGFLLYTMRRRS